jgi:hypothetical protein
MSGLEEVDFFPRFLAGFVMCCQGRAGRISSFGCVSCRGTWLVGAVAGEQGETRPLSE